MSTIRPVDMQVMIQRTQEINRTTNNDGSRAEQQSGQFAQHFQRTVDQQTRQVVNSNQAEKSDVDKDGGNGKDKQEQNKKRPHTAKEDEKVTKPTRSGLLDVRI